MNYIGIDPGRSGAIAIIRDDKVVVATVFNEKDYVDMIKFCDVNDTFAVVEKVHAFSGQGVTSMFHFGENFGWIQGLLYGLGVRTELVDPRKWLKHFGLDNDKKKHIECAKRLFPDVDMRATDRCKKDHDGIADALLIAEYGKRIKTGMIV